MRINTIIDYFMVTALIFISGSILFNQNKIALFTGFILATGLFFYRRSKFDVSFVYFLIGLMVIFILQTFKFDFFPIITFLGVFVRILLAYFILKSVVDFPDKFVKVMYYIALISFVFYIPVLLIPDFSDVLIEKLLLYVQEGDYMQSRYSIMGLYTIVPGYEMRNPGPFWEMGAFGGFLLLSLMINYLTKPELNNKTNIVLIIAIITTQSSTAYIALLLFLTFIFNREVKNILLKIILLFTLISIGYVAYTNLDFLGKKIEKQFEDARELMNSPNLEGASTDRFASMLKDWRDFQGHEIIGRGPNKLTRFTTMYSSGLTNDIRTVGSTDLIVRFGLPFFMLILFFMYKSFSTYSRYHWKNGDYMGISIVLLILLLLTSETYFLYPLFWITIMLHYTIVEDKNGNQIEKKKTKIENKFYNLNN